MYQGYDFFKGKSEAEIIAFCKKVFGVYGQKEIAKHNTDTDNLFTRIREIETDFKIEAMPEDMAREGFSSGSPDRIEYLAKKAVKRDADAALLQTVFMMSPETPESEFQRRIEIVNAAYGPTRVGELLEKAIPSFYITKTVDDLRQMNPEAVEMDYGKFTRFVSALTAADVDITEVQAYGMSVQELVKTLNDKMKELSSTTQTEAPKEVEEVDQIVEPEEIEAEEIVVEEDRVAEMSMEELIASLEEKQAIIDRASADVKMIIAQMKALAKADNKPKGLN